MFEEICREVPSALDATDSSLPSRCHAMSAHSLILSHFFGVVLWSAVSMESSGTEYLIHPFLLGFSGSEPRFGIYILVLLL